MRVFGIPTSNLGLSPLKFFLSINFDGSSLMMCNPRMS